MDDEIDGLAAAVTLDTAGFAHEVATMRATLADMLGSGADQAGRAIDGALTRAVKSGQLGFDDLRRVALSALAQIAAAAVSGGIGSLLGGGSAGGGIASLATGLVGALTGLTGLPGRATGGPVAPGAAYVVGERGPELFVPTASGQVRPAADVGGAGGGGGRDVRVSIAISAPAGAAPDMLARSSRQVARAVRTALLAADR